MRISDWSADVCSSDLRDIESAARAFYTDGFINLKQRDLKPKFLRDPAITKNDLGAIQARLTELRAANPRTTPAADELHDSDKRPTQGGMRVIRRPSGRAGGCQSGQV